LLERSGAVLRFENRVEAAPGASVIVRWPRKAMETSIK
jgi:two-component system, sensor histidine kinase RegB